MRRVFGELAMTLAAVAILLVVLAASDDRVREQMTAGMSARPGQVNSLVARARTTAGMVGTIVRNETRAHTVLVAFTVAGAILVVFMLRT